MQHNTVQELIHIMPNLLREYIKFLIENSSRPKVIFMAGGPGSGKSTVIRKLGLSSRLEVINPDDQYEKTLKDENIPMDRATLLDEYKPLKDKYEDAVNSGDIDLADSLEPEYNRLRSLLSRNMVLFNQARKDAKIAQSGHIAAGKEFLVDGTGGNYNEIASQVKKLRSAGYDVGMIFIDVPIEISVSRDNSRGERGGRRLGSKSVEKSWNAVNQNRESYKKLFGSDFFYINADEDEFEVSINNVDNEIRNFLA